MPTTTPLDLRAQLTLAAADLAQHRRCGEHARCLRDARAAVDALLDRMGAR